MASAMTSDVFLKIYHVPRPSCGMLLGCVPFGGVGTEYPCPKIGVEIASRDKRREYILAVERFPTSERKSKDSSVNDSGWGEDLLYKVVEIV
jgi:hypothetical protein